MRFVLVFFMLMGAAYAVEPDEMLSDPAQEARAEDIGNQLRCLVCQHETIETSEADFAHDMRVLIREQVAKGKSDSEIISYINSRYGDFVLMKPPLKPRTYLLWVGPALVLLFGTGMLFRLYRPLQKSR